MFAIVRWHPLHYQDEPVWYDIQDNIACAWLTRKEAELEAVTYPPSPSGRLARVVATSELPQTLRYHVINNQGPR